MTITPAQTAILKAIADYGMNNSSRAPSAQDLTSYPEVAALGLNSAAVEAELKAGQGLFMVKNYGWVPAYKGWDIIRAEKYDVGATFYAPKPKVAPVATAPKASTPASTSTTQAAPTASTAAKLGYQKGDNKALSLLEKAPTVGTVEKRGETYVIITAHSKEPFYLSQRVIDDEDLFEFEGKEATYVYSRPATNEQIADYEAAQTAEAERKAARTTEEVLAEEPVTVDDLMTAAVRGDVVREMPAGETVIHRPGFNGSSNLTLIRTATGLALHSHNPINGRQHDTIYHLSADKLTPAQALALAQLSALTALTANDDDEDTL